MYKIIGIKLCGKMSLKWDKVEKKDELYKINGKRKL
jgi:hypothetical protein